MFLDRMGLSAKSGWYDELGRVYIFYPLEEIQEDMNCGHDKATKMLVELDIGTGFGLIERKKQGLGRPTIIYVKRFTLGQQSQHPPPSSPGCGKAALQTAEKPQSRLRESRSQDCEKVAGIYTESNYPDFNYPDLSINPSGDGRWIDPMDCVREVKERIDYSILAQQFDRQELDGVVNLIAEVLCSTRPTIRIGKEDIPIQYVKSRFYGLMSDHIEYAFDCLHRTTSKIRNIRAYLLTTLYNAPITIGSFYQAEVQHDFG